MCVCFWGRFHLVSDLLAAVLIVIVSLCESSHISATLRWQTPEEELSQVSSSGDADVINSIAAEVSVLSG